MKKYNQLDNNINALSLDYRKTLSWSLNTDLHMRLFQMLFDGISNSNIENNLRKQLKD